MAKKLIRFTLHLLVGLALGLVFFYACQDRLVYHPTSGSGRTPADVGLDYDEVSLRTSDGLLLHAWFVEKPGQRTTLLFCHGNGGNISGRLGLIDTLVAVGVNVFVFDYRGYGESEGKPDEAGTYRDARAAWRHLTEEQGIAPGRIVVHGRSLGGAIASHLAARVKPGALILDSAFTSVPDMGAELFPFLPVRWLNRFRYPTVENLAGVETPVLVVHSRKDELIPFAHGQALYRAAPEPKELLVIRGGHNDNFVVDSAVYRRGIRTFLEKNGLLD